MALVVPPIEVGEVVRLIEDQQRLGIVDELPTAASPQYKIFVEGVADPMEFDRNQFKTWDEAKNTDPPDTRVQQAFGMFEGNAFDAAIGSFARVSGAILRRLYPAITDPRTLTPPPRDEWYPALVLKLHYHFDDNNQRDITKETFTLVLGEPFNQDGFRIDHFQRRTFHNVPRHINRVPCLQLLLSSPPNAIPPDHYVAECPTHKRKNVFSEGVPRSMTNKRRKRTHVCNHCVCCFCHLHVKATGTRQPQHCCQHWKGPHHRQDWALSKGAADFLSGRRPVPALGDHQNIHAGELVAAVMVRSCPAIAALCAALGRVLPPTRSIKLRSQFQLRVQEWVNLYERTKARNRISPGPQHPTMKPCLGVNDVVTEFHQQNIFRGDYDDTQLGHYGGYNHLNFFEFDTIRDRIELLLSLRPGSPANTTVFSCILEFNGQAIVATRNSVTNTTCIEEFDAHCEETVMTRTTYHNETIKTIAVEMVYRMSQYEFSKEEKMAMNAAPFSTHILDPRSCTLYCFQ